MRSQTRCTARATDHAPDESEPDYGSAKRPNRISALVFASTICAFRRGGWFGTILVNLESHKVVDLLPDRQAETAARWMRQHPDITVVSRDGGSEYAKAASQGAPQAIQVGDRFHIVQNLTEATQLLLARCLAEILAASKAGEPERGEQPKQVITIQEWRPLEPAHVEKARLTQRGGRYARYQQVLNLRTQGMKSKEIGKLLGMSERTVRDWLKRGTFPETRETAQEAEFL